MLAGVFWEGCLWGSEGGLGAECRSNGLPGRGRPGEGYHGIAVDRRVSRGRESRAGRLDDNVVECWVEGSL